MIESVIEENQEIIKERWPALDEDLSFEGMFEAAGICQRGVKECNVVCLNNNIIQ